MKKQVFVQRTFIITLFFLILTGCRDCGSVEFPYDAKFVVKLHNNSQEDVHMFIQVAPLFEDFDAENKLAPGESREPDFEITYNSENDLFYLTLIAGKNGVTEGKLIEALDVYLGTIEVIWDGTKLETEFKK